MTDVLTKNSLFLVALITVPFFYHFSEPKMMKGDFVRILEEEAYLSSIKGYIVFEAGDLARIEKVTKYTMNLTNKVFLLFKT